MLQYVVTKFETQSLEGGTSPKNPENPHLLNQVEDSTDSGTETDDETGGPEDDLAEMDFSAEVEPSSIGRRKRPSSTPVTALNALELNDLDCDETWSERRNEFEPSSREFEQYLENDGNHSSEEELEEINNKVEYDSVFPASSQTNTSQPVPFSDGGSTIKVEPLTHQRPLASNGSSSGDEEVVAITPSEHAEMELDPQPVQFSMSPPTHVHKPRRSLSPPARIFSLPVSEAPKESHGILHRAWSNSSSKFSSNLHSEIEFQSGRSHRERRAISPRKKYKQSRIHHIQRPCLDFEKMQQLKTRAITSWRHGGELSLFCW